MKLVNQKISEDKKVPTKAIRLLRLVISIRRKSAEEVVVLRDTQVIEITLTRLRILICNKLRLLSRTEKQVLLKAEILLHFPNSITLRGDAY